METLSTFEKAAEWARSGKFTQQDIDEAKLAVFAAVDAPIAPSDKGILSSLLRWSLTRATPVLFYVLVGSWSSIMENVAQQYLFTGFVTKKINVTKNKYV